MRARDRHSSDRDAHIPGVQSLAACPARPVHSRRLGPPAQAARAPRSTCPSCSGSITPSLARSFITIVYGIGAANWASPEGVIGSESNPRAHVSSSIQARAVPSPWLLVARLYDPGDRAPCQFTPWRAISELRKNSGPHRCRRLCSSRRPFRSEATSDLRQWQNHVRILLSFCTDHMTREYIHGGS